MPLIDLSPHEYWALFQVFGFQKKSRLPDLAYADVGGLHYLTEGTVTEGYIAGVDLHESIKPYLQFKSCDDYPKDYFDTLSEVEARVVRKV